MTLWQHPPYPLSRLIHPFIPRLRFSAFRKFVSLMLTGLVLSAAIAACSSGNNTASPGASSSANPVADQKKDIELTLVAYAVPKAAHDAIIPKFVEKWKAGHGGQTVIFRQSYGGSGTQTRAIIDGLDADIAHLALAADTTKLVKAGLVNADWDKKVPNNGIVAKSVVAIVTREGNPKNIKTFTDLTRDDVKWVTANPKTSGGARWNFLALWNYGLKTTKDEAKTQEFATKAFKNVAVLAKDARESTDSFARQGQGDALLNYENEIILAKSKGENVAYVVPDINVSIDTPVAVVDKNVDKHGTREVAEAFVNYLFTPEAQAEFVKLGYRPLDEETAKAKENADKFPPVKTLGSIKDYGGWSDFQKKFFEDGAIFDQIEETVGKK